MKNKKMRFSVLYIVLCLIGIYYPFFGLFLLLLMLSFFILSTYRGSFYYKNSSIDLFIKDIEKKKKLPKFIHFYFKGKLWCSVLCPKYSFLELFFKKFNFDNKFINIFKTKEMIIIIYVIILELFVFKIIVAEKTVYGLTFLFIRIFLSTGILAFLVGIPIMKKTWCRVCPMGTLRTREDALKQRIENL